MHSQYLIVNQMTTLKICCFHGNIPNTLWTRPFNQSEYDIELRRRPASMITLKKVDKLGQPGKEAISLIRQPCMFKLYISLSLGIKLETIVRKLRISLSRSSSLPYLRHER
jgi:hypothetical protein